MYTPINMEKEQGARKKGIYKMFLKMTYSHIVIQNKGKFIS